MNEWGATTYGDPCRQCGFSWAMGIGPALTLVSRLPNTYAELLDDATGDERHPELEWSVTGYVCHVGDNLRIWSERLVAVAAGAPPHVRGYDENELARARGYATISLEAARWSLTRSVAGWQNAVARSRRTGVVLVHPERGEQSLTDVVLSNAHDAYHHQWDIERTLRVAEP